jgi:ribosomal protein S18 acetylase RimI-like enzyme
LGRDPIRRCWYCSAPLASWTIRDATESDLEPVLRLWATEGVPPGVSDTRDALEGLIATDRQALIVAEADGVVIGSLIAAWDGWRGSFYRLAVQPGSRRLGIASALLHEGELRLRGRGAVRFSAIVRHEDPVAMGFWEAAGYLRQPDRTRFVRPARD